MTRGQDDLETIHGRVCLALSFMLAIFIHLGRRDAAHIVLVRLHTSIEIWRGANTGVPS